MTIKTFGQEAKRLLLDAALLGRGTVFGDAATITAEAREGQEEAAIILRLSGEQGRIEVRGLGLGAEGATITVATARDEEGDRPLPTIARNLPPGGIATISQESAKRATIEGKSGGLSYRVPLEARGYTILPLPTVAIGRNFIHLPVSALLAARSLVKPIVGGRAALAEGFDHLHFRAEGEEVWCGGTDGYRGVRVRVGVLRYPQSRPWGWSVQREAFDLLCRILHRHRKGTVGVMTRDEEIARWSQDYSSATFQSVNREKVRIARITVTDAQAGVSADLYGRAEPVWKWEAVFPSVPDLMTITVNKGLLQQWVRVLGASAFSGDIIRVEGKAGAVSLGTKHGGDVTIPASVNGEGYFYVQGRLLLSSISQWPGKSVAIGYCGGDDRDAKDGGLPLRLSVPGNNGIRLSLMPLARASVEAGEEGFANG